MSGVASNDYALDFTMVNVHVSVGIIPKRTTAVETAALIEKALNASHDAFWDGHDDFTPIGGDHSDDLAGLDSMDVARHGAVVWISVGLNS